MRLGSNWMIKSAVPESGTDTYEPKTPPSRETANAPTATTTIGTQARPISLLIALLTSSPSDAVHGVGDETVSARTWSARGPASHAEGVPRPSQSVHRPRHPRRLEIGKLTPRVV